MNRGQGIGVKSLVLLDNCETKENTPPKNPDGVSWALREVSSQPGR